MTKRLISNVTRRALLGGITSGIAGAAWANAPLTSLRPVRRPDDAASRRPVARTNSQKMVDEAGLSGAVAFAVADARTGVVLEGVDTDVPLPPASALKAVTAVYALDKLGADYRFRTTVLGTAPVSDGLLDGDLVLVGGGDPVMNTDHLARFATRLKEQGVLRVSGDLKVWAGALPFVSSIDPGQPDYVGYSPSVSGINLNFNRVHFEWKRNGDSYDVAMDARTEQYKPTVSISRMEVVERRSPVYTYSEGSDADQWTVARGALGNGGSRWLPVRKPALYAGDVFLRMLDAEGITVEGDVVETTARPRGDVLAERRSPELRLIVRDMLLYSTNITAEAMGMTATAASGQVPASLQASGRAMSLWAASKFGVAARFVDHSGLGDASAISPAEMIKILVASGPNGPLRPLLKTIPMRGEDRRIIGDHPVKVQAKTGTLNFVSALAGFADAVDGTDLAFAYFSADSARRATLTRAQRERPDGGRAWNTRSKKLQQRLLQRWGRLYGQ
ncbi:D-alanyl-D-alanine carboxypeptidase/D-alanyl-D-alanine-endopeptidase [Aestuariibius insulae]|uniref:D-alanyl-D-alanine carboxypeptidase/D-alanyl-D-alanine endopeptidase n=1 Tax=Aestuariibius insulae TaxID=2058287 RepID=UPI00345E4E33